MYFVLIRETNCQTVILCRVSFMYLASCFSYAKHFYALCIPVEYYSCNKAQSVSTPLSIVVIRVPQPSKPLVVTEGFISRCMCEYGFCDSAGNMLLVH